MNNFFTYEEGSIVLRLLIAHCLTDFIFQPGHWVANKKKHIWASAYLWYHGLLNGIIAWIFVPDPSFWWVILIITVSHILIDGVKIHLEKLTASRSRIDLTLFTTDQLLHVLIIILVWIQYIHGWQKLELFFRHFLPGYRMLLRVLGYLLMVGPVGFFIHFLTRRWTQDLNLQDSLKDAGRWIGMLERVLIITFIYTNQFAAIGFLIAAKSVLRVTDRPERHETNSADNPFSTRKHTEYVLIGTFLSFSIAIITGLVINRLLSV